LPLAGLASHVASVARAAVVNPTEASADVGQQYGAAGAGGARAACRLFS
jgi:hypothetical protein